GGAAAGDDGLCPSDVRRGLFAGAEFHLRWDYMSSFTPDRAYLGLWDVLKEFPELKEDCGIRSLWKGPRKTWEYVFIGPARTVSDIDVSRLPLQPLQAAAFARTRGLYARCEPGDALFVPKRTWHCVVAMDPSISLSVFGLTPAEIVVGGGKAEFLRLLHALHL